MIIGLGIDIIKIDRVVNIHKNHKNKFIKRILNKNEHINKCCKYEFLSKSFAIKESIVKALGTGFRKGMSFNKICIKKNLLGKPFIKKNNINDKVLISLSHEKNTVISITIILTLVKLN